MRMEHWLITASVGLLGVVIWHGRQWIPAQTIHATSEVTSPANPSVSKKASPVHRSSAKNSAWHAAASPTNELPGFPPELTSRTTPVTPQPGIPDSEQMEVGTTRSELRQRYGVPTLAVSTVQDGGLVEHYYYVKPDRSTLVVSTLREGKLISAQTALLLQQQHQKHYGTPSAQ